MKKQLSQFAVEELGLNPNRHLWDEVDEVEQRLWAGPRHRSCVSTTQQIAFMMPNLLYFIFYTISFPITDLVFI